MLMVQGKPKRRTEHANRLLTVIRGDYPAWLDRSTIAARMGKRRLTPYDLALLELLSERELIETDKQEGYSPQGYKWIYRAKEWE